MPHAPEGVAAARAAGMRVAYVTNNASRPPALVAARLTGLGIPAEPLEVVTSAVEHLALAAAMRPDIAYYSTALRGARAALTAAQR